MVTKHYCYRKVVVIFLHLDPAYCDVIRLWKDLRTCGWCTNHISLNIKLHGPLVLSFIFLSLISKTASVVIAKVSTFELARKCKRNFGKNYIFENFCCLLMFFFTKLPLSSYATYPNWCIQQAKVVFSPKNVLFACFASSINTFISVYKQSALSQNCHCPANINKHSKYFPNWYIANPMLVRQLQVKTWSNRFEAKISQTEVQRSSFCIPGSSCTSWKTLKAAYLVSFNLSIVLFSKQCMFTIFCSTHEHDLFTCCNIFTLASCQNCKFLRCAQKCRSQHFVRVKCNASCHCGCLRDVIASDWLVYGT